jgi:septal ring factor EnvC (AmiA/AmiB activator)
MGVISEINVTSAGIASVLVALLTWFLTRISKGNEMRAAADAAIHNAAPTIIAEQNKRIGDLQTEMDRLWTQLNDVYERERECQDQLREYRHQVRDLEQTVVMLKFKLNQANPG